MRSILDHESKILFDTDAEPQLTPEFEILPLYKELLNSVPPATDQVQHLKELVVPLAALFRRRSCSCSRDIPASVYIGLGGRFQLILISVHRCLACNLCGSLRISLIVKVGTGSFEKA